MNAEDRYERRGWELLRELLLLRDSGDEECSLLTESNLFYELLHQSPNQQSRFDERFLRMAHLVRGFLHANGIERPQLRKLVDQIREYGAFLRLIDRVDKLQTQLFCSQAVALAYAIEFQEKIGGRCSGGLSLLRGILSLGDCEATKFLQKQGLDVEKLAYRLEDFEDETEPLATELIFRAACQQRSELQSTQLLHYLISRGDLRAGQVLKKLGLDGEESQRRLVSLFKNFDEPVIIKKESQFVPENLWWSEYISPNQSEETRFMIHCKKGWFLMGELLRHADSDTEDWPIFNAILTGSAHPYWARFCSHSAWERKFILLARECNKKLPTCRRTLHLAKEINESWNPFAYFGSFPSMTLRDVLCQPGLTDLDFLERALASHQSNTRQALLTGELLDKQRVLQIITLTRRRGNEFRVQGETLRAASKFANRNFHNGTDNPQPNRASTLHYLIVTMELLPDSGPTKVLTSLGVTPQKLLTHLNALDPEP